ncbi:ATP dependent DNA ligase domain [Popillia japonica]|uniref:DNA ligase 4 n=1 Tax=Popillia japonica TaxID=7064 RepID=A0AAW1IW39_POPJA
MAKSTAKEVKFIELCEILEETRMARKHSDRYEILEGFFKMYRKIGEDIKRQDPAADINEYLDAIASKQVANNASHRDNMFLKLFQETSPEEQKWLIRVILKKMGLRIGDTKILNMYHPHASMCLNDTNSLLTVCNTLTDPNITVTDSEITLFTHFRPMLNRRCDAKELFKLHMENDRFKYFSRNGYDFSKKFGETYNSGLYTPLLQGVFNDNVKSIILDGEMMGWNRNTREFGSKGMNFDVKNLSDTSIHQPCFCVFDILFFNGKLISKLPLKDRVGILKDAFTEHEGIIQQSTRREAYSKEDIIRALNNSMDNKEEGIVFKDPDSTYIPNSRNGGWWKMKLEYFSGVMSDLDVIIMGGFFGKNNKIDGFIIGVSVPIDSTRKKFLSFAKVTTGLSFDEWETIRKRLDPHWIKTFGDNYENYNLNFGKMKPDVWIPPTKSCILLKWKNCGSTNWEIKDVERVIKENGGTIVKTEGDNTYCILAGEKHIRLEYYKGSVDIVKLSWLQKVIDCRQMQPYSPEDMIYISPKTKHRFLRNYDKYGDSFTDKATKYSLENVFNNIKEKGDYVCPLPAEIHELHNEINVDKKFNIFEKYMVYFDKYKVINNPQSEVIYDSSLDESVLKFWGGKSSKALTPSVNLIITFSNDENRKNEILSHYCYVKAADIVSMSFLEDKIYNRNCSNEN